ncbi:conserved hypothetical protein [delta proteobacterium NaphS2]|nr:conserved hypothetical protein [delta proteobacterium NaphS2]
MENIALTLSKIDKLLFDALHQDESRRKTIRKADLSDGEWGAFLQTAIRHNVSAFLYYRLKEDGSLPFLPEAVQTTLRERYMINSARNLGFFFRLKKILESFQEENIRVMALKGAHLAHTVYKNSSVREMSDIDLLVPPDDLKIADKVLQENGYVPDSPSDIEFELKHFAHLPIYKKPFAPAIELHWTISKPKPSYHFEEVLFWDDADNFQVQGMSLKGLSRELLLIHLCTHISHQHGFKIAMRSYCDIAELIDKYGEDLDWQRMADIAVHSGVTRGVFVSLLIANQLLGAKISNETLRSLEPFNMSDEVLNAALYQCLSHDPLKRDFTVENAKVLQRKGSWRKTMGMFQRIFLPRQIIARLYGLNPNSWYFLLFYPVRFKDLIIRHGRLIRNYRNEDKDTIELVNRLSMIENWLAEK